MKHSDSTSQQQFLQVIDRDLAEQRFHAALRLNPLGAERCALADCWGRILASDVTAPIDVPSFDRSNLDGFAVRAADTVGAAEETPVRLRLTGEELPTAVVPKQMVCSNHATPIATGAMVPRGADAVVMIEHTELETGEVLVGRSVTPGSGISFAGTDMGAGEVVLRQGTRLTSRETGVLAAIGVDQVLVWRKPRVAIVSTGDEIISPGEPMQPGMVFDSNSQILADAVRELGGLPLRLGIVKDSEVELERIVDQALAEADIVLLSGGTSKGAGDLSYRVISRRNDPGIVAHGVALKPGKPICLAVSQQKPIVILPGFPTSAIFTFHEFVAPVILRLAGASHAGGGERTARMAVKVNSEVGRTEYLLVGLVSQSDSLPGARDTQGARPLQASFDEPNLVAYPMGKGSGSVTTFSRADGFVTIDRHEEIVEQDQLVKVRLLGRELELAELVTIGSHCVGVDLLLGKLQLAGFASKFLAVGSQGGLAAASRGECDVAGIHLFDAKSQSYNVTFVPPNVRLVPGYRRQQGILFRRGDARFEGKSCELAVAAALADPMCVLVNRNAGSGTRVLIDQLLGGQRPEGYAVQPRSHNAVAAAVAQQRADWGVAIERVARQLELGFLPLATEAYDFLIPENRMTRPAVQQFLAILADPETRQDLAHLQLF
jgi:putative molybdopterin biosynthesis protein